MPVYEFACNACGARISRFVRSINAEVNGACDHCGGTDLRRLFSPFRVLRTPNDVNKLNQAALLDGVNYSDPQSMAAFLRRMGDEFNDEPNEHMDEILGRLDHGEPVEKALELDSHDHGAEAPDEGDNSFPSDGALI